MNRYRHYNTKERESAIFAGVMCVIALILAGWLAFMPMEKHQEPDVVYEMVNRNITWEGAGYDGFRAR